MPFLVIFRMFRTEVQISVKVRGEWGYLKQGGQVETVAITFTLYDAHYNHVKQSFRV